MRKERVNRGFTLVEIVIVLVVLALLIGVLFKVYQRIADISVRVRYEKTMGNSVVTTQTILQNIVDAYTIDYAAFANISQSTPGWTKQIPLLDQDRNKASLAISASGELLLQTSSGSDTTTASLLGNDIILVDASFVLSALTDPAKEKNFLQIYQPGFWLIGALQPQTYPVLRFPIHTFFSFLQK